MRFSRLAVLAVLVVLVVLGAACGDSAPSASSTTTAAQPQPALVMPLGDSITAAPSYRQPLLDLLSGARCAVDFVGGEQDPEQGESQPNGQAYDRDHEGHDGWRADQVAAEVITWTASAQPDYALVHLGTNDLLAGETALETVGDIDDVITALRAEKPLITVVLAQIIPAIGHEAVIADFNDRLVQLAADLDEPNSPVVLVDMQTGFDVDADTSDGVHPTEESGDQMARRWFRALAPQIISHCDADLVRAQVR